MNNSIPSTIVSRLNNHDKEDTKQQSSNETSTNPPLSSQHKPSPVADETKISKAIAFLSSPSINNISTLDKRNYLQHKIGMTEQEIDTALKRCATAKMDDVMKEQDNVPRHNERGRPNGLNHDRQQYRDDPYNSPQLSFQAQNNNMQAHNMQGMNQNTQDMSPHTSSSASSAIVGGFSLGIFALAAFRWLNGGDFILFPPPSTISANGECTPVKTEEELGEEGKLMNINEDDTDESLEEEEYEEEDDNEEFEEDEYEEAITNLMNGSSSNAQSYHNPTSSSPNQDDLPSYSELVLEIRTLTTAIQSYRNETERNNRIVHNKVGREMTNDAMNFLKKKKESESVEDESKVMAGLLMDVSADLVKIKQCIEVKTNSGNKSDEEKEDDDGDKKEKVDTEASEDIDKEAGNEEGPLKRIDMALEKIQKMLTIVQTEGSSNSSTPQIAEGEEKEENTSSKPPSQASSPTPSTLIEEKAQEESSSIPAPQPQEQDDTKTEQTDEQKQQQLEGAIKTLSTKNDNINDLKAGSQMLYLYCLNISKNPTVPRYRKIYTNNNTFRNKVGKLLGAKEFLSSVGFVERTNCFEWDQGTDDDGMIKSRLDFALVALELLKNGTVKTKIEENNEKPNDTVSEVQQTEVSLSTPLKVRTDIDKGIDLN